MEGDEKKEEGKISKEKKLLEDKKRTQSYLKHQVEALDQKLAENFAKGNFALAAHDARRMAAMLDVLGDIDVTG